ncbi:arginine--tRNA ligase [Candidatus Mycoplasma haematohominis]|uniref:Arginine--tRNA ligase n=1 Tax=Candidatus Mycoplasma haematohominis TaxID=1494318 RepID=A0A478FTL7_9MOLU|nr:arginine--tRNA ligase [Candidatus Mycoplasma haemohominis]
MHKIEQILEQEIKRALTNLNYEVGEISLEVINSDYEGDICTNVALQVSSKYQVNPKQIATEIVELISKNEYISSIKVENNGFINITFSEKVFQEYYSNLIKDQPRIKNRGWKYLEIVSANPTGYLHIGHTRHGILTDTLGNIFEYMGYSVKREYLVNDAGNQIKELIFSFWELWKERKYIPTKINLLKAPQEISYRGIDMQECVDNLWKKYQHRWCVNQIDKLKEPAYTEVKEIILNYFLHHIKKVMSQYNIQVDYWRHENSFMTTYNINRILREIEKYTFNWERAIWLNIPSKKEVLIKSNGEHTYFMQDIVYHEQKLSMIGPKDEIINVLGCDHYGHIDKLIGYLKLRNKGEEKKIKFICLQLVKLLEGGKAIKMSKRDSTAIFMRDLANYMTYEEVRWFFISQPSTTSLEIDVQKIRSKDYNNPVYYVIYAYSRISKILQKIDSSLYLNPNINFNKLENKERELLNQLIHFEPLLENITINHLPHKLPQYLFKLAKLFHSYYEETSILNNEIEDKDLLSQRLALLESIRRVIKTGLTLMKIEARDEL